MENKIITPVTLHVDASNYNRPNCIYAKQYDANTRYLKVRIAGAKGTLPVSGTVQLNATKPDGTHSYTGGEICEDGTILVELTSQLLSVEGKVSCDISIFDSENENQEILTTSTFFILVDKSNYDSDAIESKDEFTTVSDALTKMGKYVDEANEAKEGAEEVEERIKRGDYNIQSDWKQEDSTEPDYIKNKPDVGKVFEVSNDNGVLTLTHSEDIYEKITSYDVAIQKGFEGTEEEWVDSILITKAASDSAMSAERAKTDAASSASVASESATQAGQSKDQALAAAERAELAAEDIKEKIVQTPGGSEDLIMSQKATVDYVSTTAAKSAYTKKVNAEIGPIFPNRYVTQSGTLGASSYACATDYIPLDFDPETTITAYCTIYNSWSLVIYDKDYTVISYINGTNAPNGITPSQNMQEITITLPKGAAFIRLTGTNPEGFSVRGEKSICTEDIVLHSDEKISKIYEALPGIFTTKVKVALIGCLSKMAWAVSNGISYLNKLVNALGFNRWTEVVSKVGINTETGQGANSSSVFLTSGYIDVTGGDSIESAIESTQISYIIYCYNANKEYLGKALKPNTKIDEKVGAVYGSERLSLSKMTKKTDGSEIIEITNGSVKISRKGADGSITVEETDNTNGVTAYIRIVFQHEDSTDLYADKVLNITLFHNEDGVEKQTNLDCVLVESEGFLE